MCSLPPVYSSGLELSTVAAAAHRALGGPLHHLVPEPGRMLRMYASLWPVTPSKRQPWTGVRTRGCHSSVTPMSWGASAKQKGGALGTVETSILERPIPPSAKGRVGWGVIEDRASQMGDDGGLSS